MSLNFTAWDEAIATRLEPVRTALDNIPVGALPREAGKFGEDQFESIDWLFPTYDPLPRASNSRLIQDVTVNLTIRLYFEALYSIGIERNTLRWAESQIVSLLIFYRMPDTLTFLELLPCRLYAPSQGQWHKEINFSFNANIIPSDSIEEPLPVQLIGVDDSKGELIRVE